LIGSGVSAGRIRTFGAGEDQPIASNLTPEGRAQNRRVEIVIVPNQ
jgi:outer membrane protein OmpA-like peptidoglycan-associated protein